MNTLRLRLPLAVLLLALLACSGSGTPPPTPTINLVAPTATLAPSATLLATLTPTSAPATATPTLGAPTSTAIPSATPSYAAASAIRATTEAPAACPTPGPEAPPAPEFINFSPEFRTSAAVELVEQQALAYLNAFGPLPLIQALQAAGKVDGLDFFYRDVTNDGVPDVAFAVREFFVFGCEAGAYTTQLQIEAALALSSPRLETVQDMNLDGVPELVISQYSCGINNDCLEVGVFEWSGAAFNALIEGRGGAPIAAMSGGALSDPVPQADLFDTDLNGTHELIVYGGIPRDPEEFIEGGPWREASDVYMWNGERFNWVRRTYTSPEYRFQAVQDGDSEARFGRFAEAEAFYRSVRDNVSLRAWSPDLALAWQDQQRAVLTGSIPPTPPTQTPEDPGEFEQLVAYAQYRLVVMYARSGRIAQADAEIQTMVQTYEFGRPGYPYVQMAAQFWTGFSANASIGEGCRQAVEFASVHPEIIGVLGSEYHGVQSVLYTPADVCPFG